MTLASDYTELFRGSARLGLLVAALDVPAARTAPFVGALSEDLAAFQALSVSSADARLGLLVRGGGKAFAHRCARLMETHGVPEDELRRFLVRAAHVGHRGLEFGVRWLGTAGLSFEYALVGPLDLDTGKAMLLDGGSEGGPDALAAVDAAARDLGKRGCRALTCELDLGLRPAAPAAPPGRRDAIWFAQPGWAGADARLSPSALAALAPLRDGEPPFVAAPRPAVAVPDVPATALAALPALAADPAARERVEALLGVFGKHRADRVQVRLDAGGACQIDVTCSRTA